MFSDGLRVVVALATACVVAGCVRTLPDGLTISGSAVGREADVLRVQLARFSAARGIPVDIRATPDSADQRHQLYVQWLNARAPEPDVLQVDVVWTAEFAAAGWLLPLDRFSPSTGDFFPATIDANRWNGRLFGLPWFVDVGMLYWRTDFFDRPPATFEELASMARVATRTHGARHGLVWQAARYEGLVTVFVEVLGGFGGQILDRDGAVVVDSDAGVRALTWMRDAVQEGIVPEAALTWHEEETRFAFQNGAASMMRNWPYAYALMQQTDSPVAGRFAVAPMPASAGGTATAALGGSQLAINARTRQPADAWALVEFLTAPAQMLERARVIGQFPPRPSAYAGDAGLDEALAIPPAAAQRIIEAAKPRPVTPVYTQLSELLQIRLHRALTGQQAPRAALHDAAEEMRRLLDRVGLPH
jgi:multiple sugar transport system substrate-binding protein